MTLTLLSLGYTTFVAIELFPLEIRGIVLVWFGCYFLGFDYFFKTNTLLLVTIPSMGIVISWQLFLGSWYKASLHPKFRNTCEFPHFNRLPRVSWMTINSNVCVLQMRWAWARTTDSQLFLLRLMLWSGLHLGWAEGWHTSTWAQRWLGRWVQLKPHSGTQRGANLSNRDALTSFKAFWHFCVPKFWKSQLALKVLSSKHAALSYFSILAWTAALHKHKALGFPTPCPKK